ncbi:cytochrome P450 [Streptomyces alboflavus]|uniref:cytochrome P450 n=1 Tax=Streptomyces alboflavus TaxID=67267 RepID=UPI0004BEBB21|nr:cytochrome P450 [Streptomyces alboflavus]
MTNIADRWGLNDEFFWLRDKQPEELVSYDEKLGVWNVYGYPETVEILNDHETFSSDAVRLLPDAAAGAQYYEGDLSGMTGAEHASLRKQADRMFKPSALAKLEARLEKDAADLLDAVEGKDSFELIADFAEPLSGNLFCDMLGVPSSERELFKLVDKGLDSEVKVSTVDQGGEGYVEAQIKHIQPLRDYLLEHIADRRKNPGEDLLSVIVNMKRHDGTQLSDNESVNFTMVMLGAGYLTGTVLIGDTMLVLDHLPEEAARVRADRSLIPGMIEEALRWFTPTAATYRATSREVEFAGKTIPADQYVVAWLAAANRDPRQFSNPNVFDLKRSPNPQLAFGRGTHYCLGAHLARMQGRIAFNALMDRFPNLSADPDNPPKFFPSPEMLGMHSMPVLTN